MESLERRIANMTREERLERMRELLEPMRAYLHEQDGKEDVEAEAAAVESGAVQTNRRPTRLSSG
jgi:hypothetical protein